MKPIIFILVCYGCYGCERQSSADALPDNEAKFQREFAEHERRMRELGKEADAREAERRAAAERRWAEAERKERQRVASISKLADTMYDFGAPLLPGLDRSPRRAAAYKAHLRYVANLITSSLGDTDEPLISKEEDPYLLAAITFHESSWADSIITGKRRGTRGELGMMQLMPNGYCVHLSSDPQVDPLDPLQNLRLGANCLRQIRSYHHYDSIWKALASYGSGQPWPMGRVLVEDARNGFRTVYERLRQLRDSDTLSPENS